MNSSSPQIVHESEAQRQHVRVQIPATVFINGQEHAVKDLSNGGVQILDVTKLHKAGQTMDIVLSLPFDGFAMSVNLKAEVEHYNKKDSVLGCKFVELTNEQVSILNNVLKSYISGHVISEGDVISVLSRNNFVTVRKNNGTAATATSKKEIIKRIAPMISILMVGVIAIGFLVGNIVENISVVKSYNGVIQTENITVRTHTSGLFKSLVSETDRTVSRGDIIGEIHTRVFLPEAETTKTDNGETNSNDYFITHKETIRSPCNCTILHQYVESGEFRSIGESLFRLMPTDAEPWVLVTMPSKDASRISIHDDVKLHIGGEAITLDGIVVDMDTKGTESPISIIKVQPEESLGTEIVGRPVYAEFFVY